MNEHVAYHPTPPFIQDCEIADDSSSMSPERHEYQTYLL